MLVAYPVVEEPALVVDLGGGLVFEVPGWTGSGGAEVGSVVVVGGTGLSVVVGTVGGLVVVVAIVGVGGGVVRTPEEEVPEGGTAMVVGDWY